VECSGERWVGEQGARAVPCPRSAGPGFRGHDLLGGGAVGGGAGVEEHDFFAAVRLTSL